MLCQTVYRFLLENLQNFLGNHLDIGVFDGDGIAELAQAYPNKTIYGVDPFIEDGNTVALTGVNRGEDMASQEDRTKNRLSNYQNAFLSIVTAEDFLKLLTAEQIDTMNINSVFIDGSHWYEDVLIDMQLAVKLIGNNKGIITFDDLNNAEVKKAYDEICITYKDLITKFHTIYEDSNGISQSALHIN